MLRKKELHGYFYAHTPIHVYTPHLRSSNHYQETLSDFMISRNPKIIYAPTFHVKRTRRNCNKAHKSALDGEKNGCSVFINTLKFLGESYLTGEKYYLVTCAVHRIFILSYCD